MVQVVKNSFLNDVNDANIIGKFNSMNFDNRHWNYFPTIFTYSFEAVDWSEMANDNNYLKSAASTRSVGRNIAEVIDFMVSEHGAKLDDFHLIGHSLGEI